jgi:hypothetical protein
LTVGSTDGGVTFTQTARQPRRERTNMAWSTVNGGSGTNVETRSVASCMSMGLSVRPNRSVETVAQVRPCASRTRLLCAAHLRR